MIPARLIVVAKAITELLKDPEVTSISGDCVDKKGQVFISESAMSKFAPLDRWHLNQPRPCSIYPYEHVLELEGIKIFAITSDPIQIEGNSHV